MSKRMMSSTAILSVMIIGVLSAPKISWAQGNSGVVVVHDNQHGLSPRLGDGLPSPAQEGLQQQVPLRRPYPPVPQQVQNDPVVQSSPGPSASSTSKKNITGVGANGYAPPDTNGAAGGPYIDKNGIAQAGQYVQWVNVRFAVFDKATGSLLYGPAAGSTPWQLGLPGSVCANNNSGDPIAQYDKQAGRWVLLQPVFTSPYQLCIAVSTTSDATGSYHVYQFPIPAIGSSTSIFPDYPKLGVWPDGYYVSYNGFQNGNNFVGSGACALDRANLLAGNPATMQCFSTPYPSLLPSDLDGASGASGTTGAPPAGSPDYFVDFNGNFVNIWKFHADWTTPGNSTFTGPTSVPVAAFNEACNGGACIPQSGTTQTLDSLGDRLMYRAAYRNFGGDHQSIVLTHSVTANGVAGVRWYEIRSPGALPSVYQQGTFAPDANYRWMGSIAQDKTGDIAVGYSVSSGAIHPAIRHTGRTPSDPLGTMESETSILEGPGSQTNGLSRWGDYSSISVDPVDDCTFWYTSEYLPSSGSFNWNTVIASFSFPGCSNPTLPPPAPTGLLASGGINLVNLTWNASGGATSYNVLRSTTTGGPYGPIASNVLTTNYTDNTAAGGTTYYYVVRAVNSGGASGNSNEGYATPSCSAALAPTGLTALAGNAQVALSWTATSGAVNYNLKRGTTSGGPYTTIHSGTSTSFTDTGLNNGTTYYYVVTEVNGCLSESGPSAEASATPQSVPPAAPTNLKATNPGNSGKVTLTWTQSTSAGVTQNNVYRSTNGGAYSLLATPAAATSYQDASTSHGITYSYYVTALSGGGESPASNQASLKVK